MNSVYLETFRRRKNKLLASEINLNDSSVTAVSGHMSGNSVYLETFRRRKNQLLAAELQLTDENVSQAESPRENPSSVRSAAALTYSAGSRASGWEIPSEDAERSARSYGGEDRYGGRLAVYGCTTEQKETVKAEAAGDVSDDAAGTKQEALTENAGTVRSGIIDNHVKSKAGRPDKTATAQPFEQAKSVSSAQAKSVSSARAKSTVSGGSPSLAATDTVRAGKNNGQKSSGMNIKTAIAVSAVVLVLSGALMIYRLNHDNTWTDDGTASALLENLSMSDFAEGTQPDGTGGVTASTTAATTSTTKKVKSSATTTTTKTSATTTTTAETPTETTASAAETAYKALQPGEESKDVMKMQKRLTALGYMNAESCTGYYGDFTKKRLKQFQKKAGLQQTGIADEATLERLYADDAPKR